jgi:hypothetical protein
MNYGYYLTGWRGGYSQRSKGGTYGLRFGRLRKVLIEGKPDYLELHLTGRGDVRVIVTAGFWNRCPEVRHREIGAWIMGQGIKMPWPSGKPPRFPIERVGRNSFRVGTAIR